MKIEGFLFCVKLALVEKELRVSINKLQGGSAQKRKFLSNSTR